MDEACDRLLQDDGGCRYHARAKHLSNSSEALKVEVPTMPNAHCTSASTWLCPGVFACACDATNSWARTQSVGRQPETQVLPCCLALLPQRAHAASFQNLYSDSQHVVLIRCTTSRS